MVSKTPGRDAAVKRAAGRCEVCGVRPKQRHAHHRRPRGMGGSTRNSTESPANYLITCVSDHLELIEMERSKALDKGWLVTQGMDPEEIPVKLWDGWYYLLDNGKRLEITGTRLAALLDRSGRGGSVR